jgi:signal transduction histidine kinase
VTLSASERDGALRVAVEDTGIGFAPGLVGRAFDPFAREDDARSDEHAGLGLAIVSAIAQAHGGTAEASNRPEGGASVLMRLPRDD